MVTPTKHEVVLRQHDQWLHFAHPHLVISARTLQEVIPALKEIEQCVDNKGWHAAGFLSYESAAVFDPAFPAAPSTDFPYLWFGLYPEPRAIGLTRPARVRTILSWQPTVTRQTYNAAIAEIKGQIAQGNTYQVNYTLRLHSDFKEDAWEFFLHLTQDQHKYAAYIDAGRHVICSASPELFFHLDGEHITCRPMKGTIKRGRTTLEDEQESERLKSSAKNRAENVMIVDMIRNDLGRIARVGSVGVPELFQLERYPTLWQMTSTVTAQTRASITEIFRALFPCASITGAPKVSTMNIIQALETTPRKIYTGAIGSISPDRKVTFNVAIRTALIDRETKTAEYGIGGGIVWDSTSSDEYQEAMLKARTLTDRMPEFALLETMLWTPEGGLFLLPKHINRLLDSANYFGFSASREAIEQRLEKHAASFDSPQRVRLLLCRNGGVKIEAVPFEPEKRVLDAHLAVRPIDSGNTLLFHKTTRRGIYEQARAAFPDHDDVLLYNERRQLTEFTIGNLVLELDGEFVTPPVECGLLPGTFRAQLLETQQVVERIVSVGQLKACTRIFRINSLRRWESVRLLED